MIEINDDYDDRDKWKFWWSRLIKIPMIDIDADFDDRD